MLDYFKLQFKRFTRRFSDTGINPVFALIVLFVSFIAFSVYLFHKASFAEYVYPIIALSFAGALSDAKRNGFLKSNFRANEWRKIRVLENLIIVSPFLAFLLFKQCFLISAVTGFLAVLISFIQVGSRFSFVIPTPFSKKPFEFTVGFRSTFYLFPLIYILTVIAVYTNTFNLGIFAMLAVFAICLNYYAKPEDDFFVWSYNHTPKQFLLQKMKTGLVQSTLLITPIFLTLTIVFYENWYYILLFLAVGYAFIVAAIVAKYSAFPDEMNMTQGFLITMSVFFPPLLIVVIPYFFTQSVNRLKHYLK